MNNNSILTDFTAKSPFFKIYFIKNKESFTCQYYDQFKVWISAATFWEKNNSFILFGDKK